MPNPTIIGLMRAIASEPGDPALRGILADALDEAGLDRWEALGASTAKTPQEEKE